MPSLQVGTATAQSGQLTSGSIALGHAPDGPINAPVYIAAGESEGPVLWLQGLVHGQEVGGALAIGRFLKGLDLSALRGTVVALPIANPLAFRAWSRNVPTDGLNLNRVFPGKRSGSYTEQLAATLLETALGCADAIVDLHSGGERSHVPFYALYWADGSQASAESARLARAAATPDLWETDDDWLSGAMFTHAVKRGTPAVIVECGGGAAVPEEHIQNFLAALNGISRALKLLPGDPPSQPSYRIMGASELIFNRSGGLFATSCRAGEVVQEGQEIGRIIDVMGDVQEEIRAPFGPAYLAAIRRTYMAVHSGEMICEAIQVKQEGGNS